MKKLLLVALAATLTASIFAEGTAATSQSAKEVQTTESQNKGLIWPAFFAFCEWPNTPDIVGLRLTIPFSTRQESITGIDLGLWGVCKDFEGFQFNVLRNNVKDTFGGFQIGLYNSVNRGDLFSIQAGLWNEAQSFRGLQVGLVNLSGDAQGFQIGLINRTETMYGFQLGIINVIRDAELPMMPILNIGF